MDLTESIQPNSDQVNADDLMSGDRTVTIAGVEQGSSEQPVFVHLAEFPGRTYRPSKSMRRVMVAAWGKEASVYTGRRLTLYRDPEVTFGRDKVGGIKISAMSHIDKALSIALTATRGKRALHKVTVLPDAPQQQPDPLHAAKGQLWSAWKAHDPEGDVEGLGLYFTEQTGALLEGATAEQMTTFAEQMRAES